MTNPLNDTRGDDMTARNLAQHLQGRARGFIADPYIDGLTADSINTTPEMIDALRLALSALDDVNRLMNDAVYGPYSG